MINVSCGQLAQILTAELIGDPKIIIEQVNTDTRQSCSNSLFFALKGERFDGHHYLAQAVEQGAVAVVVEQYDPHLQTAQLIVQDSKLALGRLAQWLKQEIKPKTLAITGSSGKTSVKEMTARILTYTAKEQSAVLFTQGNFNNEIGVPLTLLRLTPAHQFAVVELGANHLGEIAYTVDLVRPDVALVNNIAPAHLEGFGSIEGVTLAKSEIYQGLNGEGIGIINLDCTYLPHWQAYIQPHQVRSFSLQNSNADYYCKDLRTHTEGSVFTLCTPQGNIGINLPYLGQHNVSNALAATALAMSVGASLTDIKQGLEQPLGVKGRLYPIRPCGNLLLLDDTYNANVDSLISAIKVLQSYQNAYRILLVGDMAELGENNQTCHQQVAHFAEQAKLDLVYSFGEASQIISMACQGQHFTDKAILLTQLIPFIKQKLNHQPVVVLAKGSRRMQMETLIQSLEGAFLC